MAKNCNTSPFYLQGQSPTIQNQVAIIERFLKKQLPNYAVITVSLNGVDIPKDEFGNVNLEIERINYAAGDGISIDDNVISCTITDTTYTAGENISIDENNVISTTVIDDSTQSNKSTWSSNKINSLIQEFNNFTITVVNQLPVSGEPYVLYLVGNGSEEQSNVKDEYLWIVENNVGRWEKIGTTQITILQSDWNQSDTTAQDYIKNKPTDLVRTSDIEGLLRNDGTVYTGKYLEQVRDLDNFQASEGKIVQYIGETNSKYTNSYIYKKVGKQTIIPAGTEYIDINDSSGNLASVGIPNGRYYSITDETDTVKTKIRIHFASNAISYPIRRTIYAVPITGEYSTNVRVGILGYASELSRVVSKESYQGSWKITFANGEIMYGPGRLNWGDDELYSNVYMFENSDGIRIYTRPYSNNRAVFILEYIEDEDVYQVSAPEELFVYELKTTSSEQTIGTEEWQQCVPPEEDTSHYVTDSEIGWIEH